ncbi:MAG: asparagine synthase (glutamine-hydrolyzing) [Candidatus Omnitrophica bacterium]|nr:asparagine synthase (glutamine-hydrolyzing) [Candidatus Omnitrophota bacterium]
MYGIVGLWGKGDIHKMADILTHRGPDGEGFYFGEKVKLGARCLKIMDRLSGEQPQFNEDKSICVVLNGEVYNFLELRNQLKRHAFNTNTDTEVIVHAYEEFGVDCVNKFNGQFAFALWDGKILLLARDRLGQKPLYYYFKNNFFIFASEIKSILTHVQAYPNITENFEVFETPVGVETLFKDIFSLPPASILIYDGREINIRKYWQITSGQPVQLSEEQCIEKLRWLIEDSVRLRLRGDVPFGLYLSGGLDSGLIAYLAKPPYVFSCYYNLGEHFDEIHYAQSVAKEIGAEHLIVKPTPFDFQKCYEKIIWHLDQPIATASTISAFLLAKEASQFVKVVLNGEGGDELFGGYIRYLLMAIENRLSEALELKSYHSLAKYFWSDSVFNDPAERYFELTKRGVPKTDLPLKGIKNIFSRHRDLINQMSTCDIEITLPSLLILADRACSAFGLENRSPYLDYRIVEFAFSLPSEMKIKECQTKYILRKLARGIVPDEIIERKDKKGLATPIFKWFSNDLHDWSSNLINSFKKRRIRIERGKSRGEFDRHLYTVVSLELWYRIFIDAKEPIFLNK